MHSDIEQVAPTVEAVRVGKSKYQVSMELQSGFQSNCNWL